MKNELKKNASVNQACNVAIRLLARREHSRVELRRKLRERGYLAELVEPVLEKLIQQGLLSDERFVESYVRARCNKGYGPVRIMAELQQRGVGAEIIAHYIDANAREWLMLAEDMRQKKFGKKIPADFNEKAKQMRFLQYRGFGMEQISRIFKVLTE